MGNSAVERARAATARHRKRNPKKYWAKKLLGRAIFLGIIQRAGCEDCGATRTEGHHDDYDKPLEVRWLCRLHHKRWHMTNGEGLNAHTPRPVVLLPLPVIAGKTSEFRGVYWVPDKELWCAEFCLHGKRTLRRKFKSKEAAARAYDVAAFAALGERARLNFPQEKVA